MIAILISYTQEITYQHDIHKISSIQALHT